MWEGFYEDGTIIYVVTDKSLLLIGEGESSIQAELALTAKAKTNGKIHPLKDLLQVVGIETPENYIEL